MLPNRCKSLVLQAILFSLTWSFVAGKRCHEKPCTIHDDGKYYNLNPLQAEKDYGPIKTPGGHDIILNVCKSVVSEIWNTKGPKEEDVGGFIQRDRGYFAIGTTNTSLTVKHGRPMLVMERGSPCPSGGNASASTAIDFICDTSVPGTGEPVLLHQLPPEEDAACSFVFEWRTAFACPTTEPDPDSWGTIPTIIVVSLSLLMLYLITGTLYNRYVLKLSGPDQIPQFSTVSMRHHATAAAEWLRDWAGGVNWAEGRRKVAGGVNSVSHQFMSNGVGQQTSRGLGVRAPGADLGGRTKPFDLESAVSPAEELAPVKRFGMENVPASTEERESMLSLFQDEEEGDEGDGEEEGEEEDDDDEEEEDDDDDDSEEVLPPPAKSSAPQPPPSKAAGSKA